MTLRFTMLGCGSSPGVPRPNGDWGKCDPNEPRNRRLRASLLVERWTGDRVTRIVIDTGPDFRQQCIAANVDRLDAVVLTHPHADHIHGIDDVRTFVLVQRQRIPVYADRHTFERVRNAFSYVFEKPADSDYPPICMHVPIDRNEPFTVDGPGGPVLFEPLVQHHGSIVSLGFRIGGLAYCSDVSAMPADTATRMNDLDVLIVDALQYREHPSHFSVRQAVDFSRSIQPHRTILTHMHTPLDYRTLAGELPDGVEPGYDGLTLELEDFRVP